MDIKNIKYSTKIATERPIPNVKITLECYDTHMEGWGETSAEELRDSLNNECEDHPLWITEVVDVTIESI